MWQNVDLALIGLERSDCDRGIDPAFEAHSQPLYYWASAVWHSWLPTDMLQDSLLRDLFGTGSWLPIYVLPGVSTLPR